MISLQPVHIFDPAITTAGTITINNCNECAIHNTGNAVAVIDNNTIGVFEQKKNYQNIDQDQLQEYVNLVTLCAPNYTVKGYFIIEEHDGEQLPENVLTFETFEDEFN
jgi:hypothetical protein